MIAESLPLSDQVATKTDLEKQTELFLARIDGRISASESRMFRWMLGFFATLWLGNAGLIITIVLKF